MRRQRAIVVADQRMHQRFGVDDHLDLIGLDPEKLSGFNDFHGLVEHGGTIDRDALPH